MLSALSHIHRFPKTYPTLTCPTFAVDKPINGITDAQATTLLRSINAEAQRFKGSEMVFDVRHCAIYQILAPDAL